MLHKNIYSWHHHHLQDAVMPVCQGKEEDFFHVWTAEQESGSGPGCLQQLVL